MLTVRNSAALLNDAQNIQGVMQRKQQYLKLQKAAKPTMRQQQQTTNAKLNNFLRKNPCCFKGTYSILH